MWLFLPHVAFLLLAKSHCGALVALCGSDVAFLHILPAKLASNRKATWLSHVALHKPSINKNPVSYVFFSLARYKVGQNSLVSQIRGIVIALSIDVEPC